MDPLIATIIVGLLATPIAAAATYFLNRKKNNVEADTAIATGASIAVETITAVLESLKEELDETRRELAEACSQLENMRKQNELLLRENKELLMKVSELKAMVEELKKGRG